MGAAPRTRLVKIGNSQGIRIPKAVISQLGLDDGVQMEVTEDRLVIRRAPHPRAGWEEAFRSMAAHGDDRLLDDDVIGPSSWDETEWEW